MTHRTLICSICDEKGHYSFKCPMLKGLISKEKERRQNNEKQETNAAMALFAACNLTQNQKGHHEEHMIELILDSGATRHMCPTRHAILQHGVLEFRSHGSQQRKIESRRQRDTLLEDPRPHSNNQRRTISPRLDAITLVNPTFD
jgi:hypothetical protein